MHLFLIRHADAVPLESAGMTTDEERPLTDLGRGQARNMAKSLHARGMAIAKVITSPLLRARQTAEEMITVWGQPGSSLASCDELAPGGKRRQIARMLREVGGEAVAVVGHQPDLDVLATWLIGSAKARITIAKAGVACIEFAKGPRKGKGKLVWMVTPEWMKGPGDKKG